MAQPRYGQPVDRPNAHRHFGLFIGVKKRSHGKIKGILNGDDEAIRYYCGKPNTDPVREDLAYIFDKDSLRTILEKLNKNEAHGVAIFNGVRSQTDSEIEKTGTYSDVNGRPTLMIFPFKYTVPERKDIDSDLKILLDDGSEHPGTGGTGTGPHGNQRNEYEIPETFTPDQIIRVAFK